MQLTCRRMHGRDDLPTGQIPKSSGDATGISPEEEHDLRLAGLALATLVLLVAHAGAASVSVPRVPCPER